MNVRSSFWFHEITSLKSTVPKSLQGTGDVRVTVFLTNLKCYMPGRSPLTANCKIFFPHPQTSAKPLKNHDSKTAYSKTTRKQESLHSSLTVEWPVHRKRDTEMNPSTKYRPTPGHEVNLHCNPSWKFPRIRRTCKAVPSRTKQKNSLTFWVRINESP